MPVIRGIGVAVPLEQRAASAHDLAEELTRLAAELPGALVVRDLKGNLAIVSDSGGGRLLYHGWINVLTGEVDMFDAPWRTAS
jgi:hypothetical protein